MEIILISGFYLGSQAKELRLVNNSTISTNYLFSLYQDNRQVYFIKYERQVLFLEKTMNLISMFNQNN